MKSGNFRSIRLMGGVMLAIFAGGGHMKASIANRAFAQNGKAKAQDCEVSASCLDFYHELELSRQFA